MNVKTRKLGNGITNVVINDPKTYNSLSFKTLRDLLNTFIRLDKDNDTRVIILEGSGKGFSAGHNLKEVGGIKNRSNHLKFCLLYTSPSPRDRQKSRMPSSA